MYPRSAKDRRTPDSQDSELTRAAAVRWRGRITQTDALADVMVTMRTSTDRRGAPDGA